MSEQDEISINVPILARVEGEGALELDVKGGVITNIKLRIYEPPRLFEKFLEGRHYSEVPDMVARICGICPVAYQLTATPALEQCMDVMVPSWVNAMRRAMYCGEWLQSHSLHVHLLATPDMLGFESAPDMAAVYPEEVKRGMRLQGLGNDLMRLYGVRSVHPIGVRVGGFHHAPTPAAVSQMISKLEAGLTDAKALVAWMSTISLPDDEQDFTSVALKHENEYGMLRGRIVSSKGLDIDIKDYEKHFTEFQVPHSTALQSHLDGKPYLVGPLARLNLNWDQLPEEVRTAVEAAGFSFPSQNMFHSVVARAAEIYFIILEALDILRNYAVPDSPFTTFEPKAGEGFCCTEAPRGMLWQRYSTNNQGLVEQTKIVPPTSQNQARIEEDLGRSLLNFGLDNSEDAIRHHSEMVIRNYDPCISCSTHFIKLKVNR